MVKAVESQGTGGRRAPLAGHTAIITGAARNIGAAIATRLAADGAAVAVNHRSESSLGEAETVVRRITEGGGRALRVQADIGVEDDVARMVALVTEKLGPPALLVNNAAVSVVADMPWREISPSDWNRAFQVNVTGNFLCARACYPAMREAGGGSIVNVSSVRALIGSTGNLHYSASKAAQLGLSRALAAEVANDHIRVNAVIVGAIKTPDEQFYGSEEEVDARVLATQMLPRRGMPNDIAGIVSFLCTEDAGFVTGQTFVVDGGMVAL